MYMLPMHKWFDSPIQVSNNYLLGFLTFIFSWMLYGTQSTMNNVHGTTQLSDRSTIFHLVLQVYCSPSLKEHLHNSVMIVLACNIQRKESILCAHIVLCVCVCINIHAYLLHEWVCGCVYTCISVCIHVCKCLPNGGYKSTIILSVITLVQHNTYSFGNC